ncbi:MAG: hypothetical protein HC877_19245 [Thioploca sp.]|nr:hypothetical protein [Thioploca sp.]
MTISARIKAIFGQDVFDYFQRKQQGGANNQRGSRYEDFFSILQLAKLFYLLMAENVQSDIEIHAQAEAFVDDLLIADQHYHSQRHFQLKNTINIEWGKGFKSISDDFEKQKRLNDCLGIENTLTVLVCSDEVKAQELKEKIPPTIANFSQVIFFPYQETLNHLLLSHEEFKDSLKRICFSSEIDKLEALAVMILGCWSDKKTTIYSVAQLLTHLQNTMPNYLAKADAGTELLYEVKNILAAIANFNYVIENGYFSWTYGNGLDTGVFLYPIDSEQFSDLQRRIIAQHPKQFAELEGILL